MERWILILYHARPELADLRGEWKKEEVFVYIVSDIGEVAYQRTLPQSLYQLTGNGVSAV